MPRPEVMHHMISGPNIGLITTRQQSQQGVPWRLVGISDSIIEGCTISNKTREINYLFPLILYPSNSTLFKEEKPTSNFNSKYTKRIIKRLGVKWTDELLENSDQLIGPKNIFNFIYAQLNSQIYRSRFEDILQRQFPNIFTPSSYKVFKMLDKIGEKLIKLILLDDKDKWLNETISNKLSKISFINESQKRIEKSFPKYIDNKIYLNKEAYFADINEDVWLFQIGSYQVCQKWLKDRKGRSLTKNDIEHYKKIIVSIGETIHLQAEIDKVIEEHGGWPGAFVTDKGGPA
jgi:predicted helicase